MMRTWRLPGGLAAALLLSALAYLGATLVRGVAWGYPLDDGWIHQVLARNVAQHAQFAFQDGGASGATSPPWALLLSLGYRLPIDPRLWAYLCGLGSLAAAVWFAGRLAGALWPDRPRVVWLARLAVLFEWHLVWAAVSGMETPLFTALTLALFDALRPGGWATRAGGWRVVALGALGGLTIAARPEGALPVLLVALGLASRGASGKTRGLTLGLLALGLALGLAPYLALNRATSSQWLPSTLAAKVNYYGRPLNGLAQLGFLWEAVVELSLGPVAIFAPAIGLGAWLSLRARPLYERKTGVPLPWLLTAWLVGHLVLYALVLPTVIHRGRYLLPILPVLLIWGAGGLDKLLQSRDWRRLAWAYAIVMALTFLYFWGLGALRYAEDTRLINERQVATGLWLRDNLPPGVPVATHDIGAIGYFSGHPIVDTAGLVSPEFAPIVRDSAAILDQLRARNIPYLAILPEWYPTFVGSPHLRIVHRAMPPTARDPDRVAMVVLETNWQ